MAYTFKHGDRPLDGLTVQRAVGRGGFGEVYYALSDSGKQLAVKYLRDNPEVELRGIAHVMNLKSPHLITIYDVRRNEHQEPFVIMEYVPGPSLRDIMTAEARLSPQKTAFFINGIASGLSYLHDRGIVHRDLKPGNIFYDDGYVKIGDYGLSKHISVSQHSGQTVSVGTVHYMAPEIGSGNYSRAIDIYALGVIVYEMLTGRLPFAGSSMGEILMRHLSERPDVSSIPEPFATIVRTSLAKKPEDRYQDVNEIVDILKSADILQSDRMGFDPASFSSVPRIERQDHETVTTPHTPPPMDVRDAVEIPGAPLPARVKKRIAGFQRRLDRKLARLEHRHGSGSAKKRTKKTGAARDPSVAALPPGRPGRMSQLFVLVAITVALSLGMAFTAMRGDHRMPEATVALAFYLVGSTVGALLTYFKLLRRDQSESALFDRLAYASVAALFMLPAMGLSGEIGPMGNDFQRLIFAPIAVLLLCNWTERIETGRMGGVQASDAFWPAAIGLIAAGVADADRVTWLGAGLGAAMSMLTQATASLWPIVTGTTGPDAADGDGSAAAAPRVPPRHDAPEDLGKSGTSPGFGAPAARKQSRTARREVAFDPDQPSFIGRTANAGLSFVAKFLMLIGLVWAGMYHSKEFRFQDGNDSIVISGAGIRVYEGSREEISVHFPPIAVFAPIAMGAFLLALSRRSAGGVHFIRGFIASLGIIGTAMLLLGSTGEPVYQFLGYGQMPSDPSPLVTVGLMLAASVGLMLWPNARPVRRIVAVEA